MSHDDGIRRAKTLGSCRELTRGEAETKLADLIQPVNAKSSEPKRRQWTVKAFIEESYFPFSRRHWKKSTAETTEDRIRFISFAIWARRSRELTRGEAETKLADLIQPVNAKAFTPLQAPVNR